MQQMRDMIEINEELCDGCGLCVPSCHEGAIRVIDGKARLVSDARCDGLGACLGHCPRGALKVVRRQAAPFVAPVPVLAVPPGAVPGRTSTQSPVPASRFPEGGCPGNRMRILKPAAPAPTRAGCDENGIRHSPADPTAPPAPAIPAAGPAAWGERSELAHWPVQIRLVPPQAPFLQDARLVIAADCVPVALPGFHREFVSGSAVMIGCPKFDDLEAYARRFTEIFSTARVRSVTVVVMEVPCCQSLPVAVRRGMEIAGSKAPLEIVVVGVDGEVRQRSPVSR